MLRNSAAATTRRTRPCASRIVTGATDSSAEGNRTGSRTPFIFHVPLEKASHRGPRTATTDRTPLGADLEALVAVEAQNRAVQRQMERPRHVSRAQQLHAYETLWTARWLRDDHPIVRSARHRRGPLRVGTAHCHDLPLLRGIPPHLNTRSRSLGGAWISSCHISR
jgi:hypothetical protein